MQTRSFVCQPSFAQQRMWLLSQLEPSCALYNITTALRLTGELDVKALQLALDALVMRHESLRTILVYDNNVLQQHCLPELNVAIELTRAAEDTSEEVSRFLLEQYHQSFDLSRAPLLRCCLLRLASDRHVLAITLHHIVSDGVSAQIMARELSEAYNAFKKSKQPSAPELQIQYADYAEWQRGEETTAAMAPQLEYWVRQLQGVEPLLLPHDRPRPSRQSFRGRTLYFKVPEALTGRLIALSRLLNSTLFMTLLSAFYVLLHRYSGQTDLAVGSPVSGRNRLELEPLIGFFVNTLTLRTKLEPDTSFANLLRRVRDVVLEAQSNQDIPFDRIVERLQPERDLSHAPLFQVMFAYQESQPDAWRLDGLDIERQQIAFDTAKFDVTLSLNRVDGAIEAAFEYSTDLFDAATIERWREHYVRLLDEIAADAHRAIRDYSLISPSERRQLLSSWGRPWRTFEVEHGIHEAFEAQAARAPHARAITFEHKHVSYGLLNSRANQLAVYIERALEGTKPDSNSWPRLVGICLPPSDELVVAILAVLKSGRGYVPIDPSLSPERMRFYIEDSGIDLVVTDAERGSILGEFGVDATCVDIEHPFIATMPETNPERRAAADDLAYVIYTSGSTGKPKGVMVSHRNVMRLLAATAEWFGFGTNDVWTLFHSTSFDFSVWELWGALLHGGRLVVVPYLTSRSPEAFLQLLKTEQVTVLNQTPSAFKQLMAADEAASAHSPTLLRYVIFGGEALDPSSLQGWISRHGDETPQLINMYGITETTVHVTYRRITREDAKVPGVSPIGVPMPDLRLYVLDAQMAPVPIGVTGEIYVGGAGVARGYLNRDELTRERFVTVNPPLETAPGQPEAQRLYRTGDLARYLPDGSIEYQGRADDQVKIRGFRIELGEVEAALRENPTIREAVVSAIQDARNGETRLVAHLVPHSRELTVEELRAHLKARLPEYMIPASFMFLDALPLTANGKVDRKALLALSGERPNLAKAYAAPRDDVERTFVDIWSTVLNLSSVGIFDNFFALGGDSLRAVQVIGRARAQGLHLDLVLLFKNQTIAELAQAAAGVHEQVESAGTAPAGAFSLISPEDRAHLPETAVDAYPLSRMQGGMFYHMLLAPQSNVYHCTGTTHLRVKGKFDEAAFRAAVRQTVARHDVLRTSFDLTGFSQSLQIVHRQAELPVVVEDLRHLSRTQQDDRVRALLESERHTPFDLSRPTLLRFFVYLRSEETLQFSMTECHPIFDGWSYHTMIVEVFNRYAGLTGRGRYIEPPALETCYRDFVAMEQASVDDPQHRKFWLDKLQDCIALRLPRMPGMEQKSGNAPRLQAVHLSLPDDVYDGLVQLMRIASVPMKSVLLAAHVKVMSLVSGETDILTGIPSNGRPERTGGDQLYGLFLNTLPYRYQLRQESWLELVKAVFDGERECLVYRCYPIAEIQRLVGRQQLIDDVLFNYMDFHVYQGLDGGLGLEVVDKIEMAEVYEGTHYALTVHFQHLTLSSQLRARNISVQIDFDANRLTREQADEIAAYYQKVLAAMARRPQARHHEQCFLAAPVYDRIVHQLSHSNPGYRGDSGNISSGGPTQSTTCYVLDAYRHPVPIGTPGELYLGGDGVAIGYPSREQLTRERFIDDPFHPGTGAKLYRTGDIVRYLPNGNIQYLRSADEQLNMRGFRIEPGEPAARLSGALMKEQSEYWQRTLAGAPELLELPTDLPRSSRQDHAGAVISLEIEESLANQLRAFSQGLGATMFMTVLAAWSTVLARLSNQRDVVIGAPVANRTRAELEPLIGYFVNAVALRLDLSGNPSLREVVHRVKTCATAAQQHQELPFEQVVELVNPVRSLAHTPVFQVMFAWQTEQLDGLRLPDLKIGPVGAPYENAKFDLTLSLVDSGTRIRGSLEYATALFERGTVERHIGYLRRVLQAMVSGDHVGIDHIDLLSATERQRILKEWTATYAHFPRAQCLHELFEAQVGRNARAIAVVHEDRKLNYEELNTRGNRLAHYLVDQGVEPNDRIAIWLDRSIDLVIAELAILKCGAVYVPLEPQAPVERIAALVADCAARLVLTHSSTEELVIGASRRVNLDELQLAHQPALNPMVPRNSEAAACVMYTSGSTGRPKGVVVPHRAIGNLILNERCVSFEAGDRVAFASNPGFDASTFEVWGPLLNGGCIVVIDYETVLAAERLGEVLHSQDVDVLFMSTGLLHQYVHVLAGALSRLRYLLVGGEVLDPRAAEALQENPPRHLLNVYGPTETTTFATTFDLASLPPDARSVPIGRPVSNAQIYVLDAHGQPVPTGVPGEIHIGGAGVALGYLGRPELTEEKFLPDPFSWQAKGRLYKTGDLGRFRSDGNIEFLGRNDQQVKLRGFRIEPGEIETCLGEHPRINQACVVVREDRPGEKRLVAYYSVRDQAADAPIENTLDAELKAHVAARLPEYMIPAACVQLPQLPLNINGKVDRRRLPAPPTQTRHEERAVMPASALEKEIQQVWADILGVRAPGIHDNFFDLGGHSLSLARVYLQLRAKGHQQLAIVDLFRFPTIHALCCLLSGASGDRSLPSRAQVERQTRDGRTRLSKLQRQRRNA